MASRYTAGAGASRVKPTPIRLVLKKNSPIPCETEASVKPAASTSAPMHMVQREPIHFMVRAGSGLDRPQARPSREKLKPAAACDQCSWPTMV